MISWKTAFPRAKKPCEKNSLIDIFYTFTMNTMQHVEEISKCADELGVTSFKFHGNLKSLGTNSVSPRRAARTGLPNSFDDSLFYVGFGSIGTLKGSSACALVHCENVEVTPIFQERLKKQGMNSLKARPRRSPDFLKADRARAPLRLLLQGHQATFLGPAPEPQGGTGLVPAGARRVLRRHCRYLPILLYHQRQRPVPGMYANMNPPPRWKDDNDAL